MQRTLAYSKKILLAYKKLPEKKHYIEFLTAVLSVPVLITVIMINLTNLNSKDKQAPVQSPQIKEQTIFVPVETKSPVGNFAPVARVTSVPVESTAPCKAGVGPVSISSPEENETITQNPVSIIIDYEIGEYCAVVWSQRINNGNWADYDDKSIALYNLPQGKIKIDLRVKSIVNGEEKMLTRTFNYAPDTEIAPTASESAN